MPLSTRTKYEFPMNYPFVVRHEKLSYIVNPYTFTISGKFYEMRLVKQELLIEA